MDIILAIERGPHFVVIIFCFIKVSFPEHPDAQAVRCMDPIHSSPPQALRAVPALEA